MASKYTLEVESSTPDAPLDFAERMAASEFGPRHWQHPVDRDFQDFATAEERDAAARVLSWKRSR